MNHRERTYLGDGLYADFDGLMFTLYADRDGGEHFVCLEPQVLQSFLRMVEERWKVRITITENAKRESTRH